MQTIGQYVDPLLGSFNYDVTYMAANLNGVGNVGIGYNFNPYFGVDFDYTYRGAQDFGVSYQSIGVSSAALSGVLSATAKTQSYAIEVIFSLPINSFKPYAKVGYAYYTTDWAFASNTGLLSSGALTFSENGNAVVYGVGTQYHLNDKFDVGAFVDGITTDTHDVLNQRLTQFYTGLNLIYHFNI